MQIDFFERVQQEGHLFVPNALPEDQCLAILPELKTYTLRRVTALYNDVPQDYAYTQYDRNDIDHTPNLRQFVENYMLVYAQAAKRLGYCDTEPRVSINHYDVGGYIRPHMDETKYRNVICIFTISGESPFHICQDRETPSHSYKVSPGCLMMLRAPRSIDEKHLRPIHTIGPVIVDRYNIVMRHRWNSGQNTNT